MMTSNGTVVGSVTNPAQINGPWGMAVHDQGSEAQVFVSNVLNGTIMRFDLSFFKGSTTILTRQVVQVGGGFSHRLDPAALVLGPSGLAYDAANDILYVASSSDNAVYAIPNAGSVQSYTGMGTMIYQDMTHLHGALDLVLAPNGDLIVANSDGSNEDPNQPSEIVEFTTAGKFVSQFSVDATGGGAFGIALMNLGGFAVRFRRGPRRCHEHPEHLDSADQAVGPSGVAGITLCVLCAAKAPALSTPPASAKANPVPG